MNGSTIPIFYVKLAAVVFLISVISYICGQTFDRDTRPLVWRVAFAAALVLSGFVLLSYVWSLR